MPKVPQLEQQVAQRPLPGAREGPGGSPESYGAGVGDTVARVGATLYESELWRADQTAVMEADTLASKEQLRIQQDVSKMHGKDAATAPDYAAQEWDAVNEIIGKTLTNDRQRGLYHSLSRQKGETMNRGALQHSNQETERYSQDTYKANLQASLDVARANADSPTQVGLELDNQEMKIRAHAEQYGYADTPQYHEEVRQVQSATHREVLNGLLVKGDDLKAKAYYDHLMAQEKASPGSSQFTAGDRDVVEKTLLEGSTRGESRRISQALISKHGMDTPEQFKAIQADIDKIKDPKVADLAQQRVEHAKSVHDQLKAQQYSENYERVSNGLDDLVRQHPDTPVRDLIPVTAWNAMHPEQHHSLELQRERLLKPDAQPDDVRAYEDFFALSVAEMAALPLEKFRAKFGDRVNKQHHDHMLTVWHAAKNITEKGGDDKSRAVFTDEQIITDTYKSLGIVDHAKSRDKWTEEEEQTLLKFRDLAARALSVLPKDASYAQRAEAARAVGDVMLKQKVTVDPGGIFGIFRSNKEVPVIGITEDTKGRIFVPLKDIPEDQQNAIKGSLRKAGKPLTRENIERTEAILRLKKSGVMK